MAKLLLRIQFNCNGHKDDVGKEFASIPQLGLHVPALTGITSSPWSCLMQTFLKFKNAHFSNWMWEDLIHGVVQNLRFHFIIPILDAIIIGVGNNRCTAIRRNKRKGRLEPTSRGHFFVVRDIVRLISVGNSRVLSIGRFIAKFTERS